MTPDGSFSLEDMHKGMRSARLHFKLAAEDYPDSERTKMAVFLRN